MDPVTVVLAGRAVERVLITCFGGLSLFLGWHLFKLGVLKQQHGEVVRNSTTFRLTAAPGVFFALFATVIFWNMSRSPVTATYVSDLITEASKANSQSASSPVTQPATPLVASEVKTKSESAPQVLNGQTASSGKMTQHREVHIYSATGNIKEVAASVSDDDLRAIQTVLTLNRKVIEGKSLSPIEQIAFKRGTNNLSGLQSRAIYQRYPQARNAYIEWQQNHGGDSAYLIGLSPQQRHALQSMQERFTTSYLSPVIP